MKKIFFILFVLIVAIPNVSALNYVWNVTTQMGAGEYTYADLNELRPVKEEIGVTYINQSLSTIKVMFKGMGSPGTSFKKVSICRAQTTINGSCITSTQTQVTFNGGKRHSGAKTVGEFTSDAITFDFDKSYTYYVTFMVNGTPTNTAQYKDVINGHEYYCNDEVDSVDNQNLCSGWTSANRLHGVISIIDGSTAAPAAPAPTVTLTTPTNNYNTSITSNEFVFNLTASNVAACQLWGNFSGTWAGNITNTTVKNGTNSFAYLTLGVARYIWNVWCNDTSAQTTWGASNYTFNVDPVTISSVTISPTSSNEKSNLTCSVITSDVTTISVTWFRKFTGASVYLPVAAYSVSSNSTSNLTTVAGNGSVVAPLGVGDLWICQGSTATGKTNSSAVIIQGPIFNQVAIVPTYPEKDFINCSFNITVPSGVQTNVSITWDKANDNGVWTNVSAYDYTYVGITSNQWYTTGSGTGSVLSFANYTNWICQVTLNTGNMTNKTNTTQVNIYPLENLTIWQPEDFLVTIEPLYDYFTVIDKDEGLTCDLNVNGIKNQSGNPVSGANISLGSPVLYTDGIYLWNINCSSTTNSYGVKTENRTIILDMVAPTVNSVSLAPTYPKWNDYLHCTFNVTEPTPFNVSISWFNSTNNITWFRVQTYDYVYQLATSNQVYTTTNGTGSFTGNLENYSFYRCQAVATTPLWSTGLNSTIRSVHPLENLTVYSPPNGTESNQYLQASWDVVDFDEGISCNINLNGTVVGTYTLQSGVNYSNAVGISFNYALLSMKMDDGCYGDVNLSATSTYDLQVCLVDSTNVVVPTTCRIYTSGNYGSGSTLSTATFNSSDLVTNSLYKVRIHWKRVGYMSMNLTNNNGKYDHGESYYPPVFDQCSTGGTSPPTYSACGADYAMATYTTSSNCYGESTSFDINTVFYSAGAACGVPNKLNSPGNRMYVGRRSVTTCRAPEGQTFTGTNATLGTCYPIVYRKDNIDICACNADSGKYAALTCAAGTATECPNSTCTYAGDSTDYSTTFNFTGGPHTTITQVNLTDKVVANGTLEWATSGGFPAVDGYYLWSVSCTATGDGTPISSPSYNYTAHILPPYFTASSTDADTYFPEIGDTITLNTTVAEDLTSIDDCVLQMNDTGTYTNKETKHIHAKTAYVVFQYQIQNYSLAASSVIAWRIVCNDSASNSNTSTVTTFKVRDTTFPAMGLAYTNSFNSNNLSVISNALYNVSLSVYAYDFNLFQLSANVSCVLSGGISYSEILDINTSYYVMNSTVNISNLPPQKCYVIISGSDDHTSNTIGTYTEEKIDNGIEFTTDNEDQVRITAISTETAATIKAGEKQGELGGKIIEVPKFVNEVTTEKRIDRYGFTFDFADKSTERQFLIESMKGSRIYPRTGYVFDSKGNKVKKYYGHFVVWNPDTHTGTWVDFNEKNMIDKGINGYTIIENDPYSYIVEITSKEDINTITFESIGGTNVENITYEFYIGSAVNMTGTNNYSNASFGNWYAVITALNAFPALNSTLLSGTPVSLMWKNISNGTYSISYYETLGRYFNQSKPTYSVSQSLQYDNFTSYQAIIRFAAQSVKTGEWFKSLNVTLIDLTSNITTKWYGDNNTNTTTTFINAGNYSYILEAPGMITTSGNATISYLDNRTIVTLVSITTNFFLLDERTYAAFNLLATDRVTFQLFCPNETIVTVINSTTPSLPITCDYQRFRFVIEYPAVTYYRTFILQPDALMNVDIYLIDLTTTQSVESSFVIDDLFDRYQTTSVWVYKLIGTELVQITADYADIEDKVLAFLIQYDEYMFEVHSTNLATKTLGNFIADSSGDRVLRLYDISTRELKPTTFYSGVTYTHGKVQVKNDTMAVLYYSDSLNGTTSVLWEIRAGTPTAAPFYTMTTTSTNFTSIYNLTSYMNQSLYGHVVVTHSMGSTHLSDNVYNEVIGKLSNIFGKPFANPPEAGFLSSSATQWVLLLFISIFAIFATIQTANFTAFIIVIIGFFLVKMGWLPGGLAGVLALSVVFTAFAWWKEHESTLK